jgi:serine/threonine protein kinase
VWRRELKKYKASASAPELRLGSTLPSVSLTLPAPLFRVPYVAVLISAAGPTAVAVSEVFIAGRLHPRAGHLAPGNRGYLGDLEIPGISPLGIRHGKTADLSIYTPPRSATSPLQRMPVAYRNRTRGAGAAGDSDDRARGGWPELLVTIISASEEAELDGFLRVFPVLGADYLVHLLPYLHYSKTDMQRVIDTFTDAVVVMHAHQSWDGKSGAAVWANLLRETMVTLEKAMIARVITYQVIVGGFAYFGSALSFESYRNLALPNHTYTEWKLAGSSTVRRPSHLIGDYGSSPMVRGSIFPLERSGFAFVLAAHKDPLLDETRNHTDRHGRPGYARVAERFRGLYISSPVYVQPWSAALAACPTVPSLLPSQPPDPRSPPALPFTLTSPPLVAGLALATAALLCVLAVLARGRKHRRTDTTGELGFQLVSEPSFSSISSTNSLDFEILSSEIEVIQIIGTGGMGTVYKGRWLNLPVAIKSVFVQNPKDRILWEASLLSKLRHPCICSFFGMSSISGVGTAVILELLHRSLYHLVHKDTTTLYPAVLADGRVFRIAHEIASGLAFLHSHSLMHRDVKTSNVMLDELLHAKVCDFGIAKDFVPQMGSDDTRGSTNSSNTLSSASSVSSMLHTVGEGTPRYMAPEVLSGKGEYNESCDVYSIGLLLWEMTHRAIIFGKAHGLQVAFQHAQDGVRPEIELSPSCEPFRGLITAAWQHDPKTRPAMLCMADELFQCTKLHQAENGTTYAIPDFSRIADCGHNSSSTTNSSDLAQHVAPASQPEGDDGGQAL